MNYDGFIGASNVSDSAVVDCERSVNGYPEAIAGPGITPKSRLVWRRRPGYVLRQTLADSPGRGKYSINGRDFCVAGGSFFELLSPTTSILRGSIPPGSSPVQFACNSIQVAFVAAGLYYCFTLATNAFAAVTAGLPAYITSLTELDTYFIVLAQGTNQFTISSPLDGLTFSALNFSGSEEPDNAVAIIQVHLYLWIFGGQDTILFQDSGNISFPFSRVAGSQIEQGCGATLSPAIADNTVFWLGSDARGPAIVYRADGLLPTRVSTHAVEEAMQGYATIADAIGSTYQAAGHVNYCLDFPTAGVRWVFDISTSMWHERLYWNSSNGTYSADIGRFHSFCFGQHLVADFNNGNIYEMTRKAATDNGAPLRWLRSGPTVSNEGQWLFYANFVLDMQVGDGLPAGAVPMVSIRWSDDGGRTWCQPRVVSTGGVGRYSKRVRVNRCGRARNRCFEVSSTDPIAELTLLAAYFNVAN